MIYHVELTEKALWDAQAAYQWIKERSEERAVQWFNGLFDVIQTLEEFPTRCSVASESSDLSREIRQLLYGKRPGVYRILFEIRGERVIVLRIRHTAQDSLKPYEL